MADDASPDHAHIYYSADERPAALALRDAHPGRWIGEPARFGRTDF